MPKLHMRRTLTLAFFILSALNCPQLLSQQVEAQVTLRADRLQPEDRQILDELPRQLETYINSYDWTGENDAILLKIKINFVIEAVTTRGSEKIFRGQFLITSPSGENFVDRNYEFPYQQGQFFDHSRSLFNPLLGLVDFYVYMAIAGELDAYFLQGGTFYYQSALDMATQGEISSHSVGWRARAEDVRLVSDADHLSLRQAKFYYYEGMFYHEERADEKRVPFYAQKVVQLLEELQSRKPGSPHLKRFLDAHHQEFCELFSYDDNRENIRRMSIVDNRHMESYQECEAGRRKLER